MREVDILEIKGWLEELSQKIKTKLEVLQEIRLDMRDDIKLAEDITNRWLACTDFRTWRFLNFPTYLYEALDIVKLKIIQAIEGYELILKNIPQFIEDLEKLQKLTNKEEG
jgi:hypothetical protein